MMARKTKKTTAASTVRNIRRNSRKRYSGEEKIRIVLEGLRGEETVAELCRREGISESVYYRWSKEFLEAGKQRLVGNTKRGGGVGTQESCAQKKCTWLGERVGKLMRYSPAEKMEIIRLVERSTLAIKATLAELDVPRSTFYRWYLRYQESGPDGLSDRKAGPRQFWNRIPQAVREQVVQSALEQPAKSPRELAWHLTDTEEYFISESSVYRILKSYDLVASPVFQMITAGDHFEKPTRRVNEMWQTDFTQFKVIGWGWYYLCTILDDYSRYILAWRLSTNMATSDVEETLQKALNKTEITRVEVKHRPRLLSDNGPAFVSQALKEYLRRYRLKHIRGAPYHPMTQGKIERYHRSMKNVVKLQTFYFPWELEHTIENFVTYYNKERYHESLDNLTPADVYYGRAEEVKTRREQIKQETLEKRRQRHRQSVQDSH